MRGLLLVDIVYGPAAIQIPVPYQEGILANLSLWSVMNCASPKGKEY